MGLGKESSWEFKWILEKRTKVNPEMREIWVKFSHYDLGRSKSAAGHAHYELDAQSGEGN